MISLFVISQGQILPLMFLFIIRLYIPFLKFQINVKIRQLQNSVALLIAFICITSSPLPFALEIESSWLSLLHSIPIVVCYEPRAFNAS